MVADRAHIQRGPRAVSAGAALLVNAGLVAVLLFAAPQFVPKEVMGPIEVIDLTDPLKPEPIPEPKPQPRTDRAPAADPIVTPQPRVEADRPAPPIATTTELPETPPLPLPPGNGTGVTGTGIAEPPLPPRPLPLVPAKIDPRFAASFQPPYPSAERRANREGSVTVRLRIGIDGRVVEVQRIQATSDAFFEATRRKALADWRWTPAKRGDVPVESWTRITVRFVLNDR